MKYDHFSKIFFPAMWYAMGKLDDNVRLATAFGNWYVDKCREADNVLGIIEMYAAWALVEDSPETR